MKQHILPGIVAATLFVLAATFVLAVSWRAPTSSNPALALTSTNVQVVVYMRATGAALSSVGLSVGAAALASSALASYAAPVNGSLLAAVASNQLTVSLVGVNGSNPSASNPVLIGFRSQTGNNTTSAVIPAAITASLSFTLASTSSQGCATGVLCRLWVELICQTESAGSCTSTLLGVSAQSSTSACYPLLEGVLQSTGTGTSGGTTVGTIQTSVASLSGKAIRIAGYVEAIWTSGTGWATPSLVQMFGPGVHKPCDAVQETTSSSPTLVSAADPVLVSVGGYYGGGSITTGGEWNTTVFLKVGATTLYQVVAGGYGSSGTTVYFSFAFPNFFVLPEATTPSFSVTDTLNNNNSTLQSSFWTAIEIMGALEPANDNGSTELRMVG